MGPERMERRRHERKVRRTDPELEPDDAPVHRSRTMIASQEVIPQIPVALYFNAAFLYCTFSSQQREHGPVHPRDHTHKHNGIGHRPRVRDLVRERHQTNTQREHEGQRQHLRVARLDARVRLRAEQRVAAVAHGTHFTAARRRRARALSQPPVLGWVGAP